MVCLQFGWGCLDRFVRGSQAGLQDRFRRRMRRGSGSAGWGWASALGPPCRPETASCSISASTTGSSSGPGAVTGRPGQGQPCGGSARGAGTWGRGAAEGCLAVTAAGSAAAASGASAAGHFGWLGDAEDVQQEGALHRVGPVPARAGEGFGCGQLTGLVGPGRLADLAPAGGAVLLEPSFRGPAAGLGLGEDPGAAPFDLDLGQPGAAAQRVVGQPLRQPPLGRRMLDLPAVRSGSRWSWSWLVAGQVARKP